MLGHCCDLLEHLNRSEAFLMFLATPTLFLQWQVKMPAVYKKACWRRYYYFLSVIYKKNLGTMERFRREKESVRQREWPKRGFLRNTVQVKIKETTNELKNGKIDSS